MSEIRRKHSRRGLVGGSTFRRTPISPSPLDKNPMPGHLSELYPVNEVNTKGQFFRASFGKNPRSQIQLDKRPLSPGTPREASGVPCLNPRRGLTLLSPVCRDPAIQEPPVGCSQVRSYDPKERPRGRYGQDTRGQGGPGRHPRQDRGGQRGRLSAERSEPGPKPA